MKTKAFTLIELLVVIAIIALLMAIIMPALSLAKKKAATTVCLSNTKNLALGWYMYMGENDGRIMSCEDAGTEPDDRFVGWIGIPRDENGNLQDCLQTNPEVTDADEIRGIEAGLLYPYVKNPKVNHCPGDKVRVSLYDRTRVFVTYSMPECLYAFPNPNHARYSLQIRTFSEITRPATRYVFVESGETRNWNMAHHFVMACPERTNLAEWGWWGPMAINHGDASVLGFCDGHAEIRKWRDRFTIERVDKLLTQGVANYGQEYPPADQTADIDYMAAGWAFRYKVR